MNVDKQEITARGTGPALVTDSLSSSREPRAVVPNCLDRCGVLRLRLAYGVFGKIKSNCLPLICICAWPNSIRTASLIVCCSPKGKCVKGDD